MDETRQQYSSMPILIVDDEITACKGLELLLKCAGYDNLISLTDSAQAMDVITNSEPRVGVVMLDLLMPRLSGEELLIEIKKQFPEIIVIIVSGNKQVRLAVDCMRNGAFDYLLKPVDQTRLITTINRAIEMYELRMENVKIRERLLLQPHTVSPVFEGIVSHNENLLRLFRYCEAVAGTRQPILITGETGVGKELFAKAVHDLSGLSGLFVPVNIAGVDASVFSDTLFGHVKGAFTGAAAVRAGLVEKAAGGTLFLDEIGDLNEEAQVKLLRLIQENEYSPLGDDTVKKSHARIIVATHKDLMKQVNDERFRRDLYYRLQTHHIHIPPLRERKDDISLLVDYFISQTAKEFGKKKPSYPPELITLLKNYLFPGNIRELRSMIYDAVSGHKSMVLSTQSFRKHIADSEAGTGTGSFTLEAFSDPDNENAIQFPEKLPTIREMTEMLVREAMTRADHKQTIAAGLLGISQQALSQRLKKMEF